LIVPVAIFRPFGAKPFFQLLPTADAVGCILSPLRGWRRIRTSFGAR
jgi:hypothetical protein